MPGHGSVGTKAHVREFRGYMEDLRAEVLRYARQGKSLDEIKQLITLPKYQGWTNYKEWFALNVEGMYRHVQATRLPNPRG